MRRYCSLKNYIKNLIRRFRKNNNTPCYRIVGCKNLELESVEEVELLIKKVGKEDVFSVPPKKLYKDKALIVGFTKIEVRTITILGLIQEAQYQSSDVELKSIKYSMGMQMAIFFVKSTGEKIEKNIHDLSKCADLINRLSPMEAFRLGMSYENQRHD